MSITNINYISLSDSGQEYNYLCDGTGLKNKKTGSLACISDQFPHIGEDTNWEMTITYHILLIGKNRYQYINHDNLIEKWEILDIEKFDCEFKNFYNMKEL